LEAGEAFLRRFCAAGNPEPTRHLGPAELLSCLKGNDEEILVKRNQVQVDGKYSARTKKKVK